MDFRPSRAARQLSVVTNLVIMSGSERDKAFVHLRKIVNISDEQEEAIRLAIKRGYESAMIIPYNKRRGRRLTKKINKAIKQGGRRRKRSRRKSHGQSTEALDGSIDLSRPSSSSFCCPRKPRPFYCKRNIDMDQLPPTEGGR